MALSLFLPPRAAPFAGTANDTMETETMSQRFGIYLAGAFGRARFIGETVAAMVTARGLAVTSTWHEPPWGGGDDDLAGLPLEVVHAVAAKNDADLANAQAILVLASPQGRETWCELTTAWRAGLPCVVVEPIVGTMPLAAYRPGVVRVREIGMAIDRLAALATSRAPTYPPPAMTGTES